MLNFCQFIGNLGRDPEIRVTQNGDKVANLRLACTERWKKDGQPQERTEWVSVVIFGKVAAIAERYLAKGSKIYVAGKMQTRKWQDQSGNDRYSTEVVLNGFDGKLVMLGDTTNRQEHPNDPAQQGPIDGGTNGGGGGDLDDEIPFAPLRELP